MYEKGILKALNNYIEMKILRVLNIIMNKLPKGQPSLTSEPTSNVIKRFQEADQRLCFHYTDHKYNSATS